MTQAEEIRSALEAGERLTPLDALERFGCFRLGARIYDLRREGMKIESEMVEDRATGKRYARYSLPPKE